MCSESSEEFHDICTRIERNRDLHAARAQVKREVPHSFEEEADMPVGQDRVRSRDGGSDHQRKPLIGRNRRRSLQRRVVVDAKGVVRPVQDVSPIRRMRPSTMHQPTPLVQVGWKR